MVDFGNTAFEGTLSPEVPVVEPVVDRSGETMAAGLASALDGLSQTFDLFAQSKASGKTGEIPGSLAADIIGRINLYADGREQGLSQSEIMTRLRADQAAWMADNPGQEVNIQSLIQKVMGDSGLATNIGEKTTQEKAKDAVLEEALKFGWTFDPNMSQDQAVSIYSKHKRDLQAIEDIDNEIKAAGQEGKLITATLQNKATVALHSAIASGLPWVQGKIDEGYRRLQVTADPQERAAIIQDINSQITNQIAVIDDMRTKSGNAVDTSYMTAGYKSLLQDFTDVANGKMSMDAYKLQNEKISVQAENRILMDPELALATSLDKLSGFYNPTIDALKTAGVARLLEGLKKSGSYNGTNGEAPPKTPDVVGTDNDTIHSFEVLTEAFKGVANGQDNLGVAPDAETVKQFNDSLIGTFKSVAKHTSDTTDPRELNAFMAFIAQPEVGKWIETHATEIGPDIQAEARQITQQYYQNVGVELINERWGAATEAIIKNMPNADIGQVEAAGSMFGSGDMSKVNLTDVIEPIWNGATIEFRVVDEFRNNAILRKTAKQLTTDVAGPLNNMVRAEAHLEGTRDYNKVYEDVFAKRLWVAGEDQPGDITDLGTPDAKTTAKATNDYFDKLSNAENATGNPNAKNPKSSAQGIYQFTTGTWRDMMRKYPDAGLTSDGRGDQAQEDTAIKLFTAENEAALTEANIPVTDANRYAAHFLGSADAVDVLQADDSESLNELLPKRVITANPFLNGWTVADFKSWLDRKF